jgi:hypothetical protein
VPDADHEHCADSVTAIGALPSTAVVVTPQPARATGADTSATTPTMATRRTDRETYPPIVTAATSAIRLNVACSSIPGNTLSVLERTHASTVPKATMIGSASTRP